MNILTIFAGWGPCGALNSAGETESYAIGTALQLLALAVSGLLLLIANSRFVRRFNTDKSPKPLYMLLNVIAGLIKVAVTYTALVVLIDFAFGDANLGGYDGNVACDPIDGGIVTQAVIILALALFLGYKQYAKYLRKRNNVN
jgi:hypothetical protein